MITTQRLPRRQLHSALCALCALTSLAGRGAAQARPPDPPETIPAVETALRYIASRSDIVIGPFIVATVRACADPRTGCVGNWSAEPLDSALVARIAAIGSERIALGNPQISGFCPPPATTRECPPASRRTVIALYEVSERNGYTNVHLLILEPEHLQPVPRGSSPIHGFGVVRRDGKYAVEMLGRTIY